MKAANGKVQMLYKLLRKSKRINGIRPMCNLNAKKENVTVFRLKQVSYISALATSTAYHGNCSV